MVSQYLLPRISARSSRYTGFMILRNTPQRRLASSEGQPPLTGAADNAFNRERRAVKLHAAESSDLWRKLMIYVTLPCLLLAALNAKNLWDEHWEHEKHRPPLEERVQYSYQNIRTKAFPWGDGDKTLFWNDKVNYKKKSE